MPRKTTVPLKEWSDEAVLQRAQSILINAAEGRRDVGAEVDRLFQTEDQHGRL
jgi:hypothetical protein